MKLTKQQVVEVVNTYIQEELIPITRSVDTLQQILYGSVLGLVSKRIPDIVNTYAEDKTLKMLGVVDEDCCVDVDLLISTVKENWKDGQPIKISNIKFNKSDLDKIYAIAKRYQ